MTFFGKSFVTNPRGEVIAQAQEGVEELLLVELDLTLIEQTRQVFPFLRDRRPEAYYVLSSAAVKSQ